MTKEFWVFAVIFAVIGICSMPAVHRALPVSVSGYLPVTVPLR